MKKGWKIFLISIPVLLVALVLWRIYYNWFDKVYFSFEPLCEVSCEIDYQHFFILGDVALIDQTEDLPVFNKEVTEEAVRAREILENAGIDGEEYDLLISWGAPLEYIYVHRTLEEEVAYAKYGGERQDKVYFYKLKAPTKFYDMVVDEGEEN